MIVAAIKGELSIGLPDAIIHCDTQWERKASIEIKKYYTVWFESHGIPVIDTTAGNIKQLGAEEHIHIPFFTQDGGPLQRQCTRHFKIDPAKKSMREFAGYHPSKPPHPKPGQFINWLGYSADEFGRMRNDGPKYQKKVYPLIKHGIHRWESIAAFDRWELPTPVRSACLCCPYRKASEWLELKQQSPQEFREAVEFDKANRHNPLAESGGSTTSALYIWNGLIPLDEVDFEAEAKKERENPQYVIAACFEGCFT